MDTMTTAVIAAATAAGGWILKAWKQSSDDQHRTLTDAFDMIDRLQEHIDRTDADVTAYKKQCEADKLLLIDEVKKLRRKIADVETQITGETDIGHNHESTVPKIDV